MNIQVYIFYPSLFPKGFITAEKLTHKDCGNFYLNSLKPKGKTQASVWSWILRTLSQPSPMTVSRSSRRLKKESNRVKVLQVKADFIFCVGIPYNTNKFPCLPQGFPLMGCPTPGKEARVLISVLFRSWNGQEPQMANKTEWSRKSREAVSQQQERLPRAWAGPASRCYFSQ